MSNHQSGFHDSKNGTIVLQWGTKYVALDVNPQQYEYSSPQRMSTFKTQSNVIQEDFGSDITTITFSGHTGQGVDSNGLNGEERFEKLFNFITEYQKSSDDGNAPSTDLTLYNNMDVGKPSYTVTIPQQGFQYSRTSEQSPLYNYALSLVVLKLASQPDSDPVATSTGGNETSQDTQSSENSASNGGTLVGAS